MIKEAAYDEGGRKTFDTNANWELIRSQIMRRVLSIGRLPSNVGHTVEVTYFQ
jgi:hypothetical protein